MVTVAVMAILLVVAAPSFMSFFDKARLRGAADDLVSFIADARTESVKRNRNVNVAFGGTVTAWCIGAKDADAGVTTTPGDLIPSTFLPCDCATPSGCLVAGQQKTLSSTSYGGVVISAVPAAVVFDSRLGAVTPLGTTTVTLTSPRRTFDLQMTLSPLGQTTLCVPAGKPSVSGFSPC